jgi:GrpB-like predicted nucleotidyltransferase (UPF0157 family)
VLTIEHVGSTSVLGLAAKPIIDLLVGVRSLTEARSCCIEPIQALGYTYLPQYDRGYQASCSSARGLLGLGHIMFT